MYKGVIIKGIGGLYYTYANQNIFTCQVRGIFRKNKQCPLPGDYVEIVEIVEDKKTAVIDKIYDRKNEVKRPAVVNVDQILLVIATLYPAPDFLLLDKLLVSANEQKIEVVICVNKIDQDEEQSKRIENIYRGSTSKIIRACAIENEGLNELKDILDGQITVLAGQSGAGKSTIINALFGNNKIETGDLSKKTDRGKHTTRHSELMPLISGGYVIDSPGFSLFELTGIPSDELQYYYPEMRDVIGTCRFQDCRHTGEPNCAVVDLINNGKFLNERYERYIILYNELKQLEINKYK